MSPADHNAPAGPCSVVDDGKGLWKVYLLACADGSYYCGITKRLERRLEEHNGLRPGGAKYTRSRRPVSLLLFRECPDKNSALSLEYAVKAVRREKKIAVLMHHTV